MAESERGLLEIAHFGWDAIVGWRDEPVYVGYLHDEEDNRKLVCWERSEPPRNNQLPDLIPWNGTIGPTWDIQIKEVNAINNGEVSVRYCGTIYRNRKKFYEHWYGDRNYAWNSLNVKLVRIKEHPLEFISSTFAEDMKERKVWFRSQPAVIDHWLGSDDCRLIIRPEEGTKFRCPPEFLKECIEESCQDPDDYYEDGVVVTTIFDPEVWWFRDNDDLTVLQNHLEREEAKNVIR